MKPIPMNTEMVRAILEGRKSVTRRYPFQMPEDYSRIKGLYRDGKNRLCAIFQCANPEDPTTEAVYARYQPGNILWVRETWHKDTGRYMYKANYVDDEKFYRNGEEVAIKWHPSIHMPREAARIFLRVTGVRVERLQECGNAQAKDEGCTCCSQFARVWDSTVPKHPNKFKRYPYYWEDNPWVWVIEFERISKAEAEA